MPPCHQYTRRAHYVESRSSSVHKVAAFYIQKTYSASPRAASTLATPQPGARGRCVHGLGYPNGASSLGDRVDLERNLEALADAALPAELREHAEAGHQRAEAVGGALGLGQVLEFANAS